MTTRLTRVRMHRKRDGWLYIRPNGEARFLTLVETLAWLMFHRVPKSTREPRNAD